MSVTQTQVEIPFFDSLENLGALIHGAVDDYKGQGYQPQTQFYAFKYEVKETGVITLSFNKLAPTPDGTPVLLSMSKFAEDSGSVVFITLDLGDYHEAISEQLAALPVGQQLSCDLTP